MNEHLKSVMAFHTALSRPQVAPRADSRLYEMDVIQYQALLMEASGEVFKSIKAGEMVEMLVGLIDLAYVALAAIAIQGRDVIDKPAAWRQDGHMLPVMQIISDKVNDCSSGSSESYSAVYCLCIHLARGFVNADFDKAFQMIHQNNIARALQSGESFYIDSDNFRKLKLKKTPDLSDCLYE
jgi:hypothetical protein